MGVKLVHIILREYRRSGLFKNMALRIIVFGPKIRESTGSRRMLHDEDFYPLHINLFQWLCQPIQGPGLLFSSIIIVSQTVGLLGRLISPSQGLYLTQDNTNRINARTHQAFMP
jgi:hypothetical protein